MQTNGESFFIRWMIDASTTVWATVFTSINISTTRHIQLHTEQSRLLSVYIRLFCIWFACFSISLCPLNSNESQLCMYETLLSYVYARGTKHTYTRKLLDVVFGNRTSTPAITLSHVPPLLRTISYVLVAFEFWLLSSNMHYHHNTRTHTHTPTIICDIWLSYSAVCARNTEFSVNAEAFCRAKNRKQVAAAATTAVLNASCVCMRLNCIRYFLVARRRRPFFPCCFSHSLLLALALACHFSLGNRFSMSEFVYVCLVVSVWVFTQDRYTEAAKVKLKRDEELLCETQTHIHKFVSFEMHAHVRTRTHFQKKSLSLSFALSLFVLSTWFVSLFGGFSTLFF